MHPSSNGRIPASQADNGGFDSPWMRQFAHVAQRMSALLRTRRTGVRISPWAPSGCRGVWPSPAALEAAERQFESGHPDHHRPVVQQSRRRALNAEASVQIRAGQPLRSGAESGYRRLCKSLDVGSIPTRNSNALVAQLEEPRLLSEWSAVRSCPRAPHMPA